MKNLTKLFGIIALVAVIGFSMAACSDGSDSTTTTTTYPVTVNGGSGSGSYTAGATVSISATVPSGQTFTSWTVNSSGAVLANANSASTTFTMPANAVTVTANFTGGSDNNTSGTNPDIGTGTTENRRYRVEVYNISSATNTYLTNTYADKTYQDVVKADVISRGHTTPINTYTNQAFSDVISVFNSVYNSIGMGSSLIATITPDLTAALQTNNRSGYAEWIYQGSNYRFLYVNRTSTGIYTVEVYNINSATYTYLSNTYGGKTSWDVVRAAVISRGHTVANTYTNQAFSDVISVFNSVYNSIGMGSSLIATITPDLTAALQTNNQKGYAEWIYQGSNYRFLYVNQE
ncbi:hypothetical protein R84B8_00737 [Treponema sp. R8-4-B8]